MDADRLMDDQEAKRRAHLAVYEAVKTGALAPVATVPCSGCSTSWAVHYHHASGYAEAQWLDVVPYCGPCHRAQHPPPALGHTFPDRHTGRILPELQNWRDRRAMTQEELAAEAGVADATVSRLETARYAARPKTVKALAAALGVTPAQLYGENE